MNEYYYEHFKSFIPNYKKQFFKAKIKNDNSTLEAIKDNIVKNWNLTDKQKREVLKEIGFNGN